MKKKILEALKTKFAGIDENFLEKKAEKMAKSITDETAIDDAVNGITLQELMDSYKDSHVTEAVKTAISNYENKYGIKNGEKVTPATPPKTETKPEIDLNAITDPNIKALVTMQMEQNRAQAKQLQDLTEIVTGMQTEKVTRTRVDQLTEILKDAPENLRKQYLADFERMSGSFKDDDDYKTWLNTTKETIDPIVASLKAKGGIFTPPGSRGGTPPPPQVNTYVQDRAKEREAAYAGANSAIKGLPQAPTPTPAT